MSWLETARGIEALEVAELDAALVGALEARGRPGPVNFHVPTFKAFATSEIPVCGLRPSRALRSLVSNVPKPGMVTLRPASSSTAMIPSRGSVLKMASTT